MERTSNNCKAYIIKGVSHAGEFVDQYFLKSIQKGYFSTTSHIWSSLFIMSRNRAFNLKMWCESIDPTIEWIVCELEMPAPKELKQNL